MKSALISGANKGIGLKTAKQLLQEGFQVYLGSRDLKMGWKQSGNLNQKGLIM
jgi:NAD(P)-dependent dehydrogenase (short-subunit alcohol dehydrogenase family)